VLLTIDALLSQALLVAGKRTPEYMAAVARLKVHGGRRSMLKQNSVIERLLPHDSPLAKIISNLRQSLCDSSHYGQSRFRSVTIAVCFILAGQMHAIASFTSAGGANKRLSCTLHL
jgi:hypothetical protein